MRRSPAEFRNDPEFASLRRSLEVYYGNAERDRAMDALYARFVGSGDLAFDITDDVSPYASPSGIHMWRAGVPAGEHTVTISIADTQQRRAEQQLRITVRDERAPGD